MGGRPGRRSAELDAAHGLRLHRPPEPRRRVPHLRLRQPRRLQPRAGYVTTVPQQALFLMNSPFVVEQAHRSRGAGRSAAPTRRGRCSSTGESSAGAPEPHEVAAGFASSAARGRPADAGPDLTGNMASARSTKRPAGSPTSGIPALDGDRLAVWRGVPDPRKELPAPERRRRPCRPRPAHAAIRRWTARGDCDRHRRHARPPERRRRRRARSDRRRSRRYARHLGRAPCPGRDDRRPLRGRTGETIDFVLDCRANDNSDSFTWAPVIRRSPLPPGAGMRRPISPAPAPRPSPLGSATPRCSC